MLPFTRGLLIFAVLSSNAVAQTARPTNITGVLLAKEGNSYRAVEAKAPLPNDTLLVSMPHSELVTKSGAVSLTLLSDIGKRGPLPILETAVTLHAAKDADLDVTLDRGLIVLTNLKKSGAATVRLRVAGESWTLTLHDPGTKIGFETYGRLQPGIPRDLKKIGAPVVEVVGLVLAGEAFVDTGTKGMGMAAPPGAASLHWDNQGKSLLVRRLAKLPDTVLQALMDRQSDMAKEISEASKSDVLAQGTTAWLSELLSADSLTRKLLGVTMAGALDDLPLLQKELATSKDAKVREQAIVALRHWLGREPGQADRLHAILTKSKGLTDVQARSVLQLLIGFDHDERQRPETYEMLIEYLNHSKQPVRELARWHLVRLAPAGKNIPFDAAAPEAERRRAVEQWQRLIPAGQLPATEKTEK